MGAAHRRAVAAGRGVSEVRTDTERERRASRVARRVLAAFPAVLPQPAVQQHLSDVPHAAVLDPDRARRADRGASRPSSPLWVLLGKLLSAHPPCRRSRAPRAGRASARPPRRRPGSRLDRPSPPRGRPRASARPRARRRRCAPRSRRPSPAPSCSPAGRRARCGTRSCRRRSGGGGAPRDRRPGSRRGAAAGRRARTRTRPRGMAARRATRRGGRATRRPVERSRPPPPARSRTRRRSRRAARRPRCPRALRPAA